MNLQPFSQMDFMCVMLYSFDVFFYLTFKVFSFLTYYTCYTTIYSILNSSIILRVLITLLYILVTVIIVVIVINFVIFVFTIILFTIFFHVLFIYLLFDTWSYFTKKKFLEENWHACSTQVVFLIIKIVHGIVDMVTIDMCKSVHRELDIWNYVKAWFQGFIYFSYF